MVTFPAKYFAGKSNHTGYCKYHVGLNSNDGDEDETNRSKPSLNTACVPQGMRHSSSMIMLNSTQSKTEQLLGMLYADNRGDNLINTYGETAGNEYLPNYLRMQIMRIAECALGGKIVSARRNLKVIDCMVQLVTPDILNTG